MGPECKRPTGPPRINMALILTAVNDALSSLFRLDKMFAGTGENSSKQPGRKFSKKKKRPYRNTENKRRTDEIHCVFAGGIFFFETRCSRARRLPKTKWHINGAGPSNVVRSNAVSDDKMRRPLRAQIGAIPISPKSSEIRARFIFDIIIPRYY